MEKHLLVQRIVRRPKLGRPPIPFVLSDPWARAGTQEISDDPDLQMTDSSAVTSTCHDREATRLRIFVKTHPLEQFTLYRTLRSDRVRLDDSCLSRPSSQKLALLVIKVLQRYPVTHEPND